MTTTGSVYDLLAPTSRASIGVSPRTLTYVHPVIGRIWLADIFSDKDDSGAVTEVRALNVTGPILSIFAEDEPPTTPSREH